MDNTPRTTKEHIDCSKVDKAVSEPAEPLRGRWTEEDVQLALGVSNDISKDIDCGESREVLRKCIAIYADMYCDLFAQRELTASEKVLNRVEESIAKAVNQPASELAEAMIDRIKRFEKRVAFFASNGLRPAMESSEPAEPEGKYPPVVSQGAWMVGDTCEIKNGAAVWQDMRGGRWVDEGEVFTIENIANGRAQLWNDSNGGGIHGRSGKYGNGGIGVKLEDLKKVQPAEPEPLVWLSFKDYIGMDPVPIPRDEWRTINDLITRKLRTDPAFRAQVRRAVQEQWQTVLTNAPQVRVGIAVLGYNKDWEHPDFNPSGTRECIRTDDGWMSARWTDSCDEWVTTEDAPTHYMLLPSIPKRRAVEQQEQQRQETK